MLSAAQQVDFVLEQRSGVLEEVLILCESLLLLTAKEQWKVACVVSSKMHEGSTLSSAVAPCGGGDAPLALKLKASFEK